MRHSIAMKIGTNARENGDIDLFRRPAGLADGLALKEPAPRDAQIAVRPNKLVPPSSGIPPEVRLGRALYMVRRRTQPRRSIHFADVSSLGWKILQGIVVISRRIRCGRACFPAVDVGRAAGARSFTRGPL